MPTVVSQQCILSLPISDSLKPFPEGAHVKVTEAHQAHSMNWISEGKTGKVLSYMKFQFGPVSTRCTILRRPIVTPFQQDRITRYYYNIKWDDGTQERAIDHSKLEQI